MPLSSDKVAVKPIVVAQNEAVAPIEREIPTKSENAAIQTARQLAAQAKQERDCLTGLASYGAAIKDGQARYDGSAFELHCTLDQKHYTAHKRNTEPKAGYRAVKWFYKDGMGRWQEAAIQGLRKTEEEESED